MVRLFVTAPSAGGHSRAPVRTSSCLYPSIEGEGDAVLSQTNTVEDLRAGWWRQWLWRPKNTWLRKLIFQLHLWSGLLLGLYVAVVCASGSAIVFRNDIYDWLESGGKAVSYKGELYHWLSWLGKLHGSLLLDSTGMTANAIGGFLTAALCLTGIIVWWPGFGSWRRALTIHANVGWKRFVFDLHGAVGVWTFAILLMWGLTGGYFVFPQPFRAVINFFTPINAPAVFRSLHSDPAWRRAQTVPAFLHVRRSNPAGIFVRSLRQFRRLGIQDVMGNSRPGAGGAVRHCPADVVQSRPRPRGAARAAAFCRSGSGIKAVTPVRTPAARFRRARRRRRSRSRCTSSHRRSPDLRMKSLPRAPPPPC